MRILKKSTLFFMLIYALSFQPFSVVAFADEFQSIEGVVADAVTGEFLPNANIVIVGSQRGAASDNQGHFIIKNLTSGHYTIKASYIGYEPGFRQIVLDKKNNPYIEFKLRAIFFQTQQVVVTATRTKKLMENVPVVTELVSHAEIEETGAENLSQVLEDRPGITIEEGVAGGKTLRMSGIDGKYILVLIDGIPLAGKFNNRMELNLIDADNIDHVEIVKGPSSALYGSEAMGGVINVITKKCDDNFSIKGHGKVGSYALYSGNVNIAGKKKYLSYFLNADHSQGGIDQNEVSINVIDTRTSSTDLKLSHKDAVLGQMNFGMGYKKDVQEGEDPVFNNETNVERLNANLSWQKKLLNRLSYKGKGYISDYWRTYTEIVRHSGHLARIDSTNEKLLGFRTDFSYNPIKKTSFDFGIDYQNDQFRSQRVLDQHKNRAQIGLFLQSESTIRDHFTIIVGGRYDKIENIEAHFSPRISGMYTASSDLKFRASWGEGFRAPSFTDMYIDYDNVFVGYKVIGNPTLKPEKANGNSFVIEYFWKHTVLINGTIYQNRFRDMILDYSVRPAVLSYRNIDYATFTGIEWQSKFYLLNNLTATLAYNHTSIRQSEFRDELSNISPHTASLRINYGLFKNRLKLSLRDQFFSDRKVREFDRRIGEYLPLIKTKNAYNLLDITATLNINHLFVFRLGVTNLMDYVDTLYGPWIGRRIFTTVDINY